MQVVSGAMARFIAWLNEDNPALDPVLKAGIAHLWLVSIHLFDDGNGRITRAVTEMLLCRADGTGKRFYSMSNQINLDKNKYYDVLEKTQKGNGDITEWLLWFLDGPRPGVDSASPAQGIAGQARNDGKGWGLRVRPAMTQNGSQ